MKDKYSGLFICDGLTKQAALKRYQKRRTDFAQKIGNLVIITGVINNMPAYYHWAIFENPFFQEPFMLYLTGISQEQIILLLDPINNTEILFLPKADPKKEFWHGTNLGLNKNNTDQLKQLTGIKEIMPINQFYTVLQQKLAQQPTAQLNLLWHQYQDQHKQKIIKDSNWTFKHKIQTFLKRKKLQVQLNNVMPQHWDFRLPLDQIDQQNALIANQKTTTAFLALLNQLKNFKTETEVAGFLNGQLQMQSSFGHSFSSMVGGGENASILHYHKNNDPLINGELLLLDFGIKWQNMHSDISRTIPINGKFNPMQKILYTIVLDTQKHVQTQVKPGITVNELNLLCWSFLKAQLQKQFLTIGGKAKLKFKDFPHFVGHLIGYQVHDGDLFRLYRHQPLKEGYCLSNEPGIYGEFSITLDGVFYHETLGIRIEDDLLVTETGCKNLSQNCPKEINELEKIIQTSQINTLQCACPSAL